jgi:hypothetical protein
LVRQDDHETRLSTLLPTSHSSASSKSFIKIHAVHSPYKQDTPEMNLNVSFHINNNVEDKLIDIISQLLQKKEKTALDQIKRALCNLSRVYLKFGTHKISKKFRKY